MKNYYSPAFFTIYCAIICVILCSCKKFVDAGLPKTQIVADAVFTNDQTATSAINGIYAEMMSSSQAFSGGAHSISLVAGTSADELDQYISATNTINDFYKNSILPNNIYVLSGFWMPLYKYIYSANSIIKNLNSVEGVTGPVKKQLSGEAKFIRAFCHFYLTNLFGPVPIVTTTDYRINNSLNKSAENIVYDQIIKDLQEAQSELSTNYSFSSGQRIRPNYWAATALLSRVYLFMKNWKLAEEQATNIINNTALYQIENLNKIFLKNSNEAIWQLMPVQPGYNTSDAIVLRSPGSGSGFIGLSNSLLKSFEKNDNRRTNWVDSATNSNVKYYFPTKYKLGLNNSEINEYQMILRLTEQYLIRAEARAELGNVSGARSDLNVIRKRAGLGDTQAIDKTTLQNAIAKERFVELFTEWGHRWLDLKRTNKVDDVLKTFKGANWSITDQLYPIPEAELTNNSHLKPQNIGY